MVRSWNAKTPEGFLFAAKVPQEITHKRVLKDCDEEFKVFVTTMEALGDKLGPLLAIWIESTNDMETKEFCGAPWPSKALKGKERNS